MTFRMGVDLGGTKTEVVVVDGARQVLHRERFPTPVQDYHLIVESIASAYHAGSARFGDDLTLGIGMPGAISPRSGLMRNSNTACLNGRPFKRDLEARLQCPVRIENDANCFALSEALYGAGQGSRVVFGVIIGTGTGGGVVVDGSLLIGPHAISGEWGHNPLPWWREEDGASTCYCGKRACIETFLSGPGFAHNFQSYYGLAYDSAEIVAAAATGDPDCSEMLERYSDQLARALAHVINIVDPHAIVLGGGMSNIDAIYPAVRARLGDYVFSDFVATPVLKAAHGDASGVFGAACLWEDGQGCSASSPT